MYLRGEKEVLLPFLSSPRGRHILEVLEKVGIWEIRVVVEKSIRFWFAREQEKNDWLPHLALEGFVLDGAHTEDMLTIVVKGHGPDFVEECEIEKMEEVLRKLIKQALKERIEKIENEIRRL